jgi:hypothetical protein
MSTAASRHYPAVQGEFESELDAALEAEAGFEGELEDEYEGELEDEYEAEFEDELEDEFEGEQFLGGLARVVGGLFGGSGDSEAGYEAGYEAEVEFDFEAEAESAPEAESEDEAESFVNPVRRIYPDAELMAHLSTRAARAQDEAEAEAFIGAVVPIAARLVPRAARLVSRYAPTLIRGTARLTRQLRRNPATRRFVTAIPVILQRTAQSLADRAARGRPITPQVVIEVLTRVASRVLGAPARRTRAVRAVRTFDRRYHRRAVGSAQRPAPGRRGQPPRTSRRRRTPAPVRRRRR